MVRPVAVATALALGAALTGAIGPPIARAEPASDLERARELYRSAEAAMQDGRYDDAARDYGAAYELSSDPALFYKIGHANERAGKCDVALVYYARYLRDGQPTEQFTALTRERIAACGGDRAGSGSAGSAAGGTSTGASAAPGPGDASGPPSSASPGSATGATSSSSPANPRPAGAPPDRPASAGGAAASTGGTSTEGNAPSPEHPAGAGPVAGSGSATAALIPPTREKVAWLIGGGALALVTLGGVLAYAASSSENDVRDLYAGFAGQPPMFDAQTRKRYDDLVDQGRSYQHLSWAAFGLAGVAAAGVAVLFAIGRGDEPTPPAPTVTPAVGPRGAGVSVRF